jgi:hypothetical protein
VCEHAWNVSVCVSGKLTSTLLKKNFDWPSLSRETEMKKTQKSMHESHLGQKDSTKCICDWGINANHVKHHALLVHALDVNPEISFKFIHVKAIIDAQPRVQRRRLGSLDLSGGKMINIAQARIRKGLFDPAFCRKIKKRKKNLHII